MSSTPIAVAAINTYLQLGDGSSPEVYSTVANVGDITGPTLSAAVVDVTSMSTTNPWRQKITTLLDAGQVSFKLYFVPDDAGHRALLGVFTSREQAPWRLIFPDQDSTRYTFTGYLSKFSTTEPVASVIEAQVTIEVVGEPNFNAA